MSKTVGQPDFDSGPQTMPGVNPSTGGALTSESGTQISGSNVRPTGMTHTGIQTSGGGVVSNGLCEVPVAPCRFGDYELIEEIARGGMGVVYRARQSKLNRVVALKMILPGMLSSPTAVDRFYDEARAAATLDHPNIVPIYDIGEIDGQHFFTMAFIEGRSLRDLVRKETISFGEAVRLIKGIAEGVGFAHDHKIIHRDLKPDNVLIDRQGRARVTDFGLAKRTDATSGLTITGQILGTPTYMSPEQALGGNRVIGTPTDIYAIGGILYYAVTGQPPFQGDTMTEVLCQVIAQPPNSPSIFNPAIPDELEQIIMKCLQKEPEKRYASCAELNWALTEWEQRAGSAVAASGVTPVRSANPGKLGSDTEEDSLFAGLPQSSPAASTKSGPQRKPWDYQTPMTAPPVVPQPQPVGSGSLELSGSRPILLPSGRTPVVGPTNSGERPPRSIAVVVAVMSMIFAVTVLVVSQGPKWWGAEPAKNGGEKPEPGPILGGNLIAPGDPKAGIPLPPPSLVEKVLSKPKTPIDLDKIPSLQVQRTDFKVKVDMLGGVKGTDGLIRFQEGDLVHYDVTPAIDCYIGIWSLNGDGTVDQVFPNTKEPEHFCRAGQTRRLPGKSEIEMEKSEGIDQAWVLASDKPWSPDQSEKHADLNFFLKEKNWQQWMPKHRGMKVRDDLKLSETVIRFQVLPRSK